MSGLILSCIFPFIFQVAWEKGSCLSVFSLPSLEQVKKFPTPSVGLFSSLHLSPCGRIILFGNNRAANIVSYLEEHSEYDEIANLQPRLLVSQSSILSWKSLKKRSQSPVYKIREKGNEFGLFGKVAGKHSVQKLSFDVGFCTCSPRDRCLNYAFKGP